MKYKILTYEYSSKRKALEDAKKILYRKNREVGSDLNSKEQEYMEAYFSEFHPDWESKRGSGIKCIRRVLEPNYGRYRAFHLYRIDGTNTDISYTIQTGRNYHLEFRKAMREIIKPQIKRYRESRYEDGKIVLSDLSNKPVQIDNCHVDHFKPTFEELIQQFIDENHVVIDSSLFPKDADNQVRYKINDEELAERFAVFHEERCNLRILSSTENLSRK